MLPPYICPLAHTHIRVNLSSLLQSLTKKPTFTIHGTCSGVPPLFRFILSFPLSFHVLARRCSGSISSVSPLGVRNTEGSPLPILVARKYYLLFSFLVPCRISRASPSVITPPSRERRVQQTQNSLLLLHPVAWVVEVRGSHREEFSRDAAIVVFRDFVSVDSLHASLCDGPCTAPFRRMCRVLGGVTVVPNRSIW